VTKVTKTAKTGKQSNWRCTWNTSKWWKPFL